MPALRDIQRAFARGVLLGRPDEIAAHVITAGIPAANRLAIYRNTSRTVITGALRLTFPAVDRLGGTAFYDMAAARFIPAQPPITACLDDHGAGFADFLATMPEAAELRYLPDVARFEWALAVAARAPDVPPLNPADLADVVPSVHESLRFEPHPSVTVLHLAFPADSIADAVLSGDTGAMAAIDLADGPIRLVVHRGPNGVHAERVTPQAHNFLVQLFAGEALGPLLDGATPDAAAILAQQFMRGRLAGFSVSRFRPLGR